MRIFGPSFRTVMLRSAFDAKFNQRLEADPQRVAVEEGLSEEDAEKLVHCVTVSTTRRSIARVHEPVLWRAIHQLDGDSGALSAWTLDAILDLAEACGWWAEVTDEARQVLHDKELNRRIFRMIGRRPPPAGSLNQTRERFLELCRRVESELDRREGNDHCSTEYLVEAREHLRHLEKASRRPMPDSLC